MPEFLKKDFSAIVESLLADLSAGLGGRVAITDTTEGSVVRTLVEAFSRELAVAYGQLEQVYRLGYLDTADGAALENVVALLGIARRRGGYLEGTVTFTRGQPSAEAISIPAGTPVAGKETLPFETTATSAIPAGGTEITVEVRSTEPVPPRPPPDQAAALARWSEKLEKMTAPGALDTMPRPMFGVEGVANRVRLLQEQEDESDAELRERAGRVVSAGNLGTRAALELALRGLGLSQVAVDEPKARPGTVEVVVGDVDFDPAQRARAVQVIEEARPAGIQVILNDVTWIWLRVEATLVLDDEYSESERRSIQEQLQQSLARYVEGLPPGESARAAKIRNILASHDQVSEVITRQSDGEEAMLSAAVEDPPSSGVLQDQTARRRLRNGDIQVSAGERAGLDTARRLQEPFALRLEPPAPRVFLDVDLQLNGGAATEQDVRDALRSVVSTMVEQSNREPLLYATLETALHVKVPAPDVFSVRFLVLHARDGRAVELLQAGDSEGLDPRERLELRQVSILRSRA